MPVGTADTGSVSEVGAAAAAGSLAQQQAAGRAALRRAVSADVGQLGAQQLVLQPLAVELASQLGAAAAAGRLQAGVSQQLGRRRPTRRLRVDQQLSATTRTSEAPHSGTQQRVSRSD